MEVKYYELNCGRKATEEELRNGTGNGSEICRGLIDAEYSIAIIILILKKQKNSLKMI